MYNAAAFSSVADAITAAAGASGVGTVYIPPVGIFTLSSDCNVPIHIEGQLSVSGTVNFNGTVTGPLKKIFVGSGTVKIGNNTPLIYPEWFGTTKDNSADDQPAIVAALNAVTNAVKDDAPNQSVALTGSYYIGNTITLSNSQMFKVFGGATLFPHGSFAGDCLVWTATNSTVTDIPTIRYFNQGAGLTIRDCNVIKATGICISQCQVGVKMQGVYKSIPGGGNGGTLLDNYVNIQFIVDCQIGVLWTDDGSATTFQGNEFYCNFYTNNNNRAGIVTPWQSSDGISNNIAACLWDNVDQHNWDGNQVSFKAIDINDATNSYCFYNKANNPAIDWIIECPHWLGGINSHNYGNSQFIAGQFRSCSMLFRISADFGTLPWGITNIQGYANKVSIIGGGGNYSQKVSDGSIYSDLPAQKTSVANSTFADNPPCDNKITLTCDISGSSIPNNGLFTLYAYSPWTDGYLYYDPNVSANAIARSNNFAVTILSHIGLIFEGAIDNNANNPNEIIMYFRNVSGSTLTSGKLMFILNVGA